MDFETQLVISGILFQLSNAVISILLVKYYAAFLTLRSKKHFFPLACFGTVYFLVFHINRLLFSTFDFGSFEPLIGIIIYAVVIYTMSILLFKKNFGMQLFLLFSFLVIRDISTTISNVLDGFTVTSVLQFVRFLYIKLNIELNSLYSPAAIANYLTRIIYLLIFVIIIALPLKIISKIFIYKNYILHKSELLFLVLPNLACLFITNLIYLINIHLLNSTSITYRDTLIINFLIMGANVFFLLVIIVSIKLLQKNIQLHIDEKNVAVLQTQMQQIHGQIQDVDNVYSEIRGMRHDMKSHLSNIQILVRSILDGNRNVVDELEEYLGKLGDTLNKFEFTYKTGNSISDVIIHQKYTEAINKKIAFSSDFLYPTRLNLDAYDLAVILNNALENAIEACTNVSETDRFIRVYSYTKGEMFFINIENSFAGRLDIDEDTALPMSKKDDKTAHGIGLSNIQRCARNYYGDIDFQVSEKKDYNIFRLTVMLQSRN